MVPPVVNPETELARHLDSITFQFDHTKDFTVPISEELLEHCAGKISTFFPFYCLVYFVLILVKYCASFLKHNFFCSSIRISGTKRLGSEQLEIDSQILSFIRTIKSCTHIFKIKVLTVKYAPI